jgi:hypothetical protein
MSVGFQSPLSSANTNAAFVSRTQDSDMIGKLDNQNATDATSTATGAIHTAGGLGVEKKAYLNEVFVPSLSGEKALVTSALKKVVESTVTASELEELSGITGNVQDQLDLKANDSEVVHKTGAETIAGVKTFSDDTNLDGDVVIDGNLTVNGTTTTVNSATLDVTDTNITVNNSGNDALSEGAGLTVERTGTFGSFVYENALASRFKAGDIGSESEVITASTNQTMTGDKTIGSLKVTGSNSYSETFDSTSTGSNASIPALTPIIRLTNASLVSFDNIEDVVVGKTLIITNATGADVDIINDAGGTAVRRIITGTGSDLTLANDSSVYINYDSNVSRWRVTGGSGAGGPGLTLDPIGSTANANGASYNTLTGVLNLEPADASFGGVVTTTAQSFAGDKSWLNNQVFNAIIAGDVVNNSSITGSAATLTAPARTLVRILSNVSSISDCTGAINEQLFIILNKTGSTITILHDTGTNGFYCPGNADFALEANQSVIVIFSSADSRFLVMSGGGGKVETVSVQTVSGGGTVNSSQRDRQLRYVQGSSGGSAASITPFGAGPWPNATEIILIGESDSDYLDITFNDNNNGVVGNFVTYSLTKYKGLRLIWKLSELRWLAYPM